MDDLRKELNEATVRAMTDILFRSVQPSPLFEVLAKDYKPPTRWQIMLWRLHRIKDAWDVLTGKRELTDG